MASIAALIDLAPPSRIGEATSYNSLGLYLGLAFGPPLGELLVRIAGFSAAWYGAAMLSLIAAAVAAKITNVRSAAPTDRPAKLIHWKAVPPALGFFASVVAMGALFAFGSLQANAVGLMPTSTPLFVYGLVVVAGRLSLARFLDRFPPLWLGAVALMIIGSGLLIMALWNIPIGVTLGAGVLASWRHAQHAGFLLCDLRNRSDQANGVPPRVRQVCFSILRWAAARCCSGWRLRLSGIPFAFGIAAAVALLGCVWILVLLRLRPRPKAPVEPCCLLHLGGLRRTLRARSLQQCLVGCNTTASPRRALASERSGAQGRARAHGGSHACSSRNRNTPPGRQSCTSADAPTCRPAPGTAGSPSTVV